MPELTTIHIHPDTYGTKYLHISKTEAHNRMVNESRAKQIALNWEEASRSPVILIKDNGHDRYFIADGQHRIYAASEYRKDYGGGVLHAVVWDSSEIADVGKFIQSHNRGTPLNRNDLLTMYRDRSIWPVIAEEEDVHLVFAWRSNDERPTWAAFINGAHMGKRWEDLNSFTSHRVTKHEMVDHYWLGTTEEMHAFARSSLRAITWFIPVLHGAWHEYHLRNFGSAHTIAFAIAMGRKYGQTTEGQRALAQGARRIMISGKLPEYVRTQTGRQRSFATANLLLSLMNRNVSVNFFSLFGLTGRE